MNEVRRGTPLAALDRSLTRRGQDQTEVLRETVAFAREVEELGFRRFWVSEHHSVPGIAGSAPTVLAAAMGAVTSRIRVGTGGVMLPNHQPLVVVGSATRPNSSRSPRRGPWCTPAPRASSRHCAPPTRYALCG